MPDVLLVVLVLCNVTLLVLWLRERRLRDEIEDELEELLLLSDRHQALPMTLRGILHEANLSCDGRPCAFTAIWVRDTLLRVLALTEKGNR